MNLELLTNRLELTPLTEQDIDISITLWTDPRVAKYVCDPVSEEELRAEMPDATRRGGNGCLGIWCVADRVTGEKYGEAYLLPKPVDEPDNDFSLLIPGPMPGADIALGYYLKPSVRGKGFATEISKCLIEFAFLHSSLNELVASVEDENIASKHVLENSGFQAAGRAKSYGKISPIYRLTREEWTQLRPQKRPY
jgi:ribosomal-protein-alanine N-acetyltransferase